MNPYASDKALAHMDRLRRLYDHMTPGPVHVHFIVSDLCNELCNFCAYRAQDYTDMFLDDGKPPKRLMAYDKALEILADLRLLGVKAVQFTGGGEPAMHPKLVDLMSAALAFEMEVSLVTNGSRLTADIESVLMRATWTRVSVDCGTAETYASMRRMPLDTFDRVWRNVESLVSRRNKEKSGLTIGIGFVVTRDNWRELPLGVATAKSVGVDNIRLSAVFQSQDAAYFTDFGGSASALCKQAESENTDVFTVINNFDARLGDLVQKAPKHPLCCHQFLVPYIGADLNVYRCCVLSYTERGLVGSLVDRRLRDFWGSPEWTRVMYEYDARTCSRCQFNDKNETMHTLMRAFSTPHVNHL